MASLHTTPMAVVMPRGVDAMVDPPASISHSRQPEWLRRHSPSDYVPPFLLSSLALDASRGHSAGYPTSCITGTRLGDVCLLLSAAGPTRNLISLTQFPLSSSTPPPPSRSLQPNRNFTSLNQAGITSIDSVSLAQLASSGYRPWYTRANAPLLQLALNYSCLDDWSRTLSLGGGSSSTDLPIVAARSASSVEFWKLEQHHLRNLENIEQQQETGDGEDGDGEEDNNSSVRNTRWKLQESSLGVVHLPSFTSTSTNSTNLIMTADVAWCHYMTHRCAVLCTNGTILDVDVENNNSTNTNTRKKQNDIKAPIGWAPSSQLLSDLGVLSETTTPPSPLRTSPSPSISLRCVFTANHPRHVAVSLHNRLGTVDLRSGGSGYKSGFSQEIYSCPSGQWISALATPFSNSSTTSTSCSHYLAASTATEILLFDLRRPHAVLASWEHSMTAEGKVKDMNSVYAAVPDTLTWLPPSWKENTPHATGGGAAVGAGGASTPAAAATTAPAAACKKGGECRYQLVASNSMHGKAIVCEWNEHRSRGGIAAAKKGKLWEYALPTSLRKNNNRNEDSEEEEEDELDDAEFAFEPACWTEIIPEQPPRLLFNLHQQIRYPSLLAAAVDRGQELGKHRATTLAVSSGTVAGNEVHRAVRLLPSPWTGPAFLGIGVVSLKQEWKEKSTDGDGDGGGVVFAMLSPTQEIILATLDDNSSSITTTATTATTTATPNNNNNTNSLTTTKTSVAPLQILNPVAPDDLFDPGSSGVEEILQLDSSGRIMENLQITLAKEATGGVGLPSTTVASAEDGGGGRGEGADVMKKKVDTYPQFNVKQPVYVGLSLHKWLLEEFIRQYETSSEEYQAIYPFPPPQDEEETEEQGSLEEKIQAMELTSARVPFTAGEAWSLLTSSSSQDRHSILLQGITPALPGGSRKKRATTTSANEASGSGGSGSTFKYSPTETFIAALTRAGVVPLPPHIRSIPGLESNSTGLATLQSRAPFFPSSLPAFSALIEKCSTVNDGSEIAAERGLGVDNSQKLVSSTLSYKKQQLKVTAALGEGGGAEEVGGSQDVQNQIGALRPPEIATEVDAKGHNIVFIPNGQDYGQELGELER